MTALKWLVGINLALALATLLVLLAIHARLP
jgi:hypothetical protein